MKLSTYLLEYRIEATRRITPDSRQNHEAAIRHLIEFFGDLNVEDITEQELERFSSWLDQKVTTASAVLYRKIAKRFLRSYAAAHPLSHEDLHKLVMNAGSDEWKALIILTAKYGIRLEDALALSWKNIRAPQQGIRYKCGKTGQDVRICGASDVFEILERLSQGRGGFLFSALRHFKKTRLEQDFRMIVSAAGLVPKIQSLVELRKSLRGEEAGSSNKGI